MSSGAPPAEPGGPLPLGVVLPCRNSAAYLPRHLEGLTEWIDLAQEVVVVDSESTDGTLDLLKEGLHHPRVRYLSHPPGLYASWNFAAQQVEAPYTYFATVGDRISRAGLLHLVEVAQRHGSDVVISPPRFVAQGGGPAPTPDWPIHRLLRALDPAGPEVLRGIQAFLVTVLMCPSGALGSSASNLYRTDLLRRFPFPARFGHGSDTAWTLLHGLETRWALTPQAVAEFLVHASGASAADPDGTLEERLLSVALETSRAHGPPALHEVVEDWSRRVTELRQAERRLRELRRRGGLWRLHPATWLAHMRRGRLRAGLDAHRRALEASGFGAGLGA